MRKILITGGNGQIAYELVRLASLKNYQFYAPTHAELDIGGSSRLLSLLQAYRPDVVINTAAYTQVDQAEKEKEKEKVYAVNCDGAKNLAIACAEYDCPLLHLSTDYIFNGALQRPYTENDAALPISVYGLSKWQGEQMIREHWDKHIILRVSAVFGVHGNNFLKTILQLAKIQKTLSIVYDQKTCPTPAKSIASVLLQLMQGPHWGTYHFCGDTALSWYEFAALIVRQAGLRSTSLEAVPTLNYLKLASRPLYSVLDCDHIKNVYSIQQANLMEGLNDVLSSLSTA